MYIYTVFYMYSMDNLIMMCVHMCVSVHASVCSCVHPCMYIYTRKYSKVNTFLGVRYSLVYSNIHTYTYVASVGVR